MRYWTVRCCCETKVWNYGLILALSISANVDIIIFKKRNFNTTKIACSKKYITVIVMAQCYSSPQQRSSTCIVEINTNSRSELGHSFFKPASHRYSTVYLKKCSNINIKPHAEKKSRHTQKYMDMYFTLFECRVAVVALDQNIVC